jgi:hypothetical protein
MAQLYACYDRLCQDDMRLYSLGEAIEHLRSKHKLSFIRRPFGLGVPDSHGWIWYCFHCEKDTGKDHRSFRSDKAMWDHLRDRHDCEINEIKPE